MHFVTTKGHLTNQKQRKWGSYEAEVEEEWVKNGRPEVEEW